MSYALLPALGTPAQSFHFKVTPEKQAGRCGHAQSDNCMLGLGKNQETYGEFMQSGPSCSKYTPYCCPKGFVGRPKVPLFEYTAPGHYPVNKETQQYPGCCVDTHAPQGTPKGFSCMTTGGQSCTIKKWRPPVF